MALVYLSMDRERIPRMQVERHVELLHGSNNHHICEAIYKGFARAMRAAVEVDPRKGGAIPSTKGQLGG